MCMKEIDCLFVGPELPEKRSVVGCGIGDSDYRRAALSGRPRRRVAPSPCRLPHSCFQASAVRATDRSAGRLARFLVPVGAEKPRRAKRRRSLRHRFRFGRPVPSCSFRRLPAFVNRRLRHDGAPNLSKISARPPACSGTRSSLRTAGPVRYAQVLPERTTRFPPNGTANGRT